MASINISRTYADGVTLFEADLDAICESVEAFINTTKLNDDNIQDAGITASTKLVDGTVTAPKLASDSVTTAKITDANVTAAKLASDSVTTAKILDANVTTAKIADAAITQAKRAALGEQVSSSSGTYSTSSISYSDVTNLSVEITTTGRRVRLLLIPDGTTSPSSIKLRSGSSTTASGEMRILRGVSDICYFEFLQGALGTDTQIAYPVSSIVFEETPAAGTYTYKLQAVVGNTFNALQVNRAKLVAYEL
jgi:hypothetical protein